MRRPWLELLVRKGSYDLIRDIKKHPDICGIQQDTDILEAYIYRVSDWLTTGDESPNNDWGGNELEQPYFVSYFNQTANVDLLRTLAASFILSPMYSGKYDAAKHYIFMQPAIQNAVRRNIHDAKLREYVTQAATDGYQLLFDYIVKHVTDAAPEYNKGLSYWIDLADPITPFKRVLDWDSTAFYFSDKSKNSEKMVHTLCKLGEAATDRGIVSRRVHLNYAGTHAYVQLLKEAIIDPIPIREKTALTLGKKIQKFENGDPQRCTLTATRESRPLISELVAELYAQGKIIHFISLILQQQYDPAQLAAALEPRIRKSIQQQDYEKLLWLAYIPRDIVQVPELRPFLDQYQSTSECKRRTEHLQMIYASK